MGKGRREGMVQNEKEGNLGESMDKRRKRGNPLDQIIYL